MSYGFFLWVFHQKWLTSSKRIHEWLMKGFSRLADRGHQDAQELYGFLLLYKGSDAQSKSAGARYLMCCVSEQRPKVCWQLYKLYQQGNILGFPADTAKAKKYFELAKKAGHPLALEVDFK